MCIRDSLDGLLNYDDDQAVSPDTIISELGKQLEEATNGFVKGVVREYEGLIESYDQLSAFASIASALGTSVIHKEDVYKRQMFNTDLTCDLIHKISPLKNF